MSRNVSAEDLMEAAMCLWEEALQHTDREDVKASLEAHGYAQTRLSVMALALPCHLDWMAAADYDAPFDWEYVPAWLALNVTFSDLGVDLAAERRQPVQPQPEDRAR